ncbi:unnamed protein product [Protopolystoma xenopodis]|uniref:Uncharacterized protein n=1 Tax=Protopolystoma xenopodis TaxID=117903 RepID=A0A3S5CUL4_9PLAT|nr:unnamed protein product [Protopolystoma xenopodis]
MQKVPENSSQKYAGGVPEAAFWRQARLGCCPSRLSMRRIWASFRFSDSKSGASACGPVHIGGWSAIEHPEDEQKNVQNENKAEENGHGCRLKR